mgnify:CR=1 FL=1
MLAHGRVPKQKCTEKQQKVVQQQSRRECGWGTFQTSGRTAAPPSGTPRQASLRSSPMFTTFFDSCKPHKPQQHTIRKWKFQTLPPIRTSPRNSNPLIQTKPPPSPRHHPPTASLKSASRCARSAAPPPTSPSSSSSSSHPASLLALLDDPSACSFDGGGTVGGGLGGGGGGGERSAP